jgi:hypothetical protein
VNGSTILADPGKFALIVKCHDSIGQSFGWTETWGDRSTILELEVPDRKTAMTGEAEMPWRSDAWN